jgi:hypothetical protein
MNSKRSDVVLPDTLATFSEGRSPSSAAHSPVQTSWSDPIPFLIYPGQSICLYPTPQSFPLDTPCAIVTA